MLHKLREAVNGWRAERAHRRRMRALDRHDAKAALSDTRGAMVERMLGNRRNRRALLSQARREGRMA